MKGTRQRSEEKMPPVEITARSQSSSAMKRATGRLPFNKENAEGMEVGQQETFTFFREFKVPG